ncbi:YjgN family protein [Sphingomonas colocasiae]|uniref:DUF898 domain-containing protein n=1 Tax=Sphingomonas colocasiae TaxID=1848973 RepID=A0ABS7PTJ4_9SPHN|nr:YjgN family protein [Sphingomonas colocasiae]MBY8824553.1 DUF898 domain-containing protein [Sphingomonas colocasiae]
MDDHAVTHDQGAGESAFAFDGSWREFAPIAITNLLLTIVTLGIYRFWATTRERRYLWSRTRFIDDRFEWTGTGLELFIGFVLVLLLVFVPLFVLQFVAQGMILRGHVVAVGILFFLLYMFFFYLFGIARFRALRYRLSRSWWRGIRGGSDDQGWRYGWSFLWKTVVSYLALALMIPWSMASLWNERWNAMSFGAQPFESDARWGNLFLRYLLCWALPWVMAVGLMFAMIPVVMIAAGSGEPPGPGIMIAIFALVLAFYVLIPLAALVYYAAFMREAVGALRLGTIEFAFTARTKHWLLLFLGNFGLWLLALAVAIIPLMALGLLANFTNLQPGETPFSENSLGFVVTLVVLVIPFALVGPFIRYRTWRFGVTWLEAYGEIDADVLTQSTTRTPTQGEGLLDAFDVGAI